MAHQMINAMFCYVFIVRVYTDLYLAEVLPLGHYGHWSRRQISEQLIGVEKGQLMHGFAVNSRQKVTLSTNSKKNFFY